MQNEAQRQLDDMSRANEQDNRSARTVAEASAADLGDARHAFEAYCSADGAGNRNHRDELTPGWDELGPRQQAGWIVAARAIRNS